LATASTEQGEECEAAAPTRSRRRLVIVTPVYNDWESFHCLLRELDREAAASGLDLAVMAVDDGSIVPPPADGMSAQELPNLRLVEIVELACNLGHQRAIALGLVEAARRTDVDAVVVMDADGEDRPGDINALMAAHERFPGHIVAASRAARSEGFVFRVFYRLYRWIFRALTGKVINFGNFSLIPFDLLKRIVHLPDVWNNLPAALVKSRLPITFVPSRRGTRYSGASQMNFISLIIHGMSAISVFADVSFTRLLLGSAFVSLFTLAGMIAVVAIRIFTTLAIPGWATNVFGLLVMVLVQMVLIATVSMLSLLSNRSAAPVVPIVQANTLVAGRKVVLDRKES
jgi:hypothetical protein